MARTYTLPLSGREAPSAPAWFHQLTYLQSVGRDSLRTERTYRSAMRLFADWLQHFGHEDYATEHSWPLSPAGLKTATILKFRHWLLANRARPTVTTYLAAVVGYLHFLDGLDELPAGVQLGKLGRQIARQPV